MKVTTRPHCRALKNTYLKKRIESVRIVLLLMSKSLETSISKRGWKAILLWKSAAFCCEKYVSQKED
ncbi:hypothetical protein P186_0945 [Pyrobaculum ferrireducens]|uniref:Uncharacterized protein n=1 Tax=Pyrobaculum ferrireducens TaxID=1104324 RepID=G7VBF6_9CREN|nr:hypothetical protein P186_0945 [Pyrobaculum ferrireducens]